MDWAVQKASELGAASVTPLVTNHTVVRPNPSRQGTQQSRWQRIATEAAQQSEQWEVPQVLASCVAGDFFKRPVEGALNLILTERYPGQSLASVVMPQKAGASIRIAVGPEGGWTQEELEQAVNGGFVPISMGERILRGETATIAALSILQSRLGELG